MEKRKDDTPLSVKKRALFELWKNDISVSKSFFTSRLSTFKRSETQKKIQQAI
jgi:hypothetical protein